MKHSKITIAWALLALLMPVAQCLAGGTTTYYYAKLTAKVADACSGMGKVYAGTSTTAGTYNGTESTSDSQSTTSASQDKTFYAFAQPEANFEFVSWTAGENATISESEITKNPAMVTVKTSSSGSGTTAGIVTANFAKIVLPAFSVSFAEPENGTYTVDGAAAVNQEGLTEAYMPALVATPASGYSVLGWYAIKADGTKTFFSYQASVKGLATADTVLGVQFYSASDIAAVATFADLQAELAGTSHPVVRVTGAIDAEGAALTVPNGKLLLLAASLDNVDIAYDGNVKFEENGYLGLKGAVARVGQLSYLDINDAIAAWSYNTLTLLADVTVSATVNKTYDTTRGGNYYLNLGTKRWTTKGADGFKVYVIGGTALHGNSGFYVYGKGNGGVTVDSGKFCFRVSNDAAAAAKADKGHRMGFTINGGVYNGGCAQTTQEGSGINTANFNFDNNGADGPLVVNGEIDFNRVAMYFYGGTFEGSISNYGVGGTQLGYMCGGKFKSMPTSSNMSGKSTKFYNFNAWSTVRILSYDDKYYYVTTTVPADYGVKVNYDANSLQAMTGWNNAFSAVVYTHGYLYYSNVETALSKHDKNELTFNANVKSSTKKTLSSGSTFTIDVTAEGAEYSGNVSLNNSGAKFVIRLAKGKEYTGTVTPYSGRQLHVDCSESDDKVVYTYSSSATTADAAEVQVGDKYYETIYDALYAVDGTKGQTVTLLKDIEDGALITNGRAASDDGISEVTVDLNGHAFTLGSIKTANNAKYTLTIIDSVGGGTVKNTEDSIRTIGFKAYVAGNIDDRAQYTLLIKGGTWSLDPRTFTYEGDTINFVPAEGCTVTDNGNGTWTVAEIKTVDITVPTVAGMKVTVVVAGEEVIGVDGKYTVDPGSEVKVTYAPDTGYFGETVTKTIASAENGSTVDVADIKQPQEIVARIGGSCYASLEAALIAAKSGDEIETVKEGQCAKVDGWLKPEATTIKFSGKTVELDVAEGVSIKPLSNTLVMAQTGGKLEIKDGSDAELVWPEGDDATNVIVVTGGKYTSDPTKFLAEGLEAKEKGGKFVVAVKVVIVVEDETLPEEEKNITTTVVTEESDFKVNEEKVETLVSEVAGISEEKKEEIVKNLTENTKVEGVKLTTVDEKTVNEQTQVEEVKTNGVKAVVLAATDDAKVTKNDEGKSAEEQQAAKDFVAAIEAAANKDITVKVDVIVTPTAYVPPAQTVEEGAKEGVASFKLEPEATVTVKVEGESEIARKVPVTNDMIDQNQKISVTIFMGFKPVLVVHTDDDGNVIERFEGDKIAYDPTTSNVTVMISHFSNLTGFQDNYVAMIGTKGYATLDAAIADLGDAASTVIKVLGNTSQLTAPDGYYFVETSDGWTLEKNPTVAIIGTQEYDSIEKAIAAFNQITEKGEYTLEIVKEGTYTVSQCQIDQKDGIKLVIKPADGVEVTLNGATSIFKVNGNSHYEADVAVIIEGITFDLAGGANAVVAMEGDNVRYAHNLIVTNCAFIASSGTRVGYVFGAKSNSGPRKLLMVDCVATNINQVLSGYAYSNPLDPVNPGVEVLNSTLVNCKAILNNQGAGSWSRVKGVVATDCANPLLIQISGGDAPAKLDVIDSQLGSVSTTDNDKNKVGIINARYSDCTVNLTNTTFVHPNCNTLTDVWASDRGNAKTNPGYGESKNNTSVKVTVNNLSTGVSKVLDGKTASATYCMDASNQEGYGEGVNVADLSAPVCQIGEKKYQKLQKAINEVKEGETIELLACTIEEGEITLPDTLKNVTIKGAANHESILKNTTLAHRTNNGNWQGVTIDGIVFDGGHILVVEWGQGTLKDITITDNIFRNVDDTTNEAAIHFNNSITTAINGFTVTGNTIDGFTGGEKSGIYAHVTGNCLIKDNLINNVTCLPMIIQVADGDGVADKVEIVDNTCSGTAVGRLQAVGNGGTDDVTLTIRGNIVKDATSSQQICCWGFNDAKVKADLAGNYYDQAPDKARIYWQSGNVFLSNTVEAAQLPHGSDKYFNYYTELNDDGTIKTESKVDVFVPVCKIGETPYPTLEAAVEAATAGQTITMVANETLTKELAIGADKQVVLDLNGWTVSNAATGFEFTTTKSSSGAIPARFTIVVEGALEICDKSEGGTGRIDVQNHGYGTTKALLVKGTGNVTLTGGTVYGQYAGCYAVGYTGMTPMETSEIPSVLLNGGVISGGTAGVAIKGKTALLVVNEGATVKATNGYAICTNGTTDWYDGGNCQIIVNGGTITAEAGAAIYNPAEAIVTIRGGVLTGGTALAIKGGQVNIDVGATIVATGAKAEPAAAFSGFTETGDALYIEDTYDNHAPVVKVTGGTFRSANGLAARYFTNKTAGQGSLALSGGTYSSDPSVYVIPGYVANKVRLEETDWWVVGEVVNTGDETKAVVIIEQQTSSVDTNNVPPAMTEEIVEKIEQNTTVTGVKLIATNETVKVSGAQSVVDLAKETGSEEFRTNLEKGTNVLIHVDVEVTPVAYTPTNVTTAAGVISYNFNPIATVTIDEGGVNKTNRVEVTNEMLDLMQDIVVSVYTGFRPKRILHTTSDGGTIIETFAEDQILFADGVATFTIAHFSDGTAYERDYTAFIGTVGYTNLTEAAAAQRMSAEEVEIVVIDKTAAVPQGYHLETVGEKTILVRDTLLVVTWDAVRIDNRNVDAAGEAKVYPAADTQAITLPAAWGELPEDKVTVTVKRDERTLSEESLEGTEKGWSFNTEDLAPGIYTVKAAWRFGGADKSVTVTYEIRQLADGDWGFIVVDNRHEKNRVYPAETKQALSMPAAWGFQPTEDVTVTVKDEDGNVIATETVAKTATSWELDTTSLEPGKYSVSVTWNNGVTTQTDTVTYGIELLASGQCLLSVDNRIAKQTREAKDNEPIVLPASWSDVPVDEVTLTITDPDGAVTTQKFGADDRGWNWNTLPLMPGSYLVKLFTGATESGTIKYSIASLGQSEAAAGMVLDNVYDEANGVRDIAKHSNVFSLTWPDAGAPLLTLDGENVAAEPDAEGYWTWDTSDLTYALYTFTNRVDGVNHVAKFRVKSDKLAVLFGGNTNNVLVAKDWYGEVGPNDSRKVISEQLKQLGENGIALWKSYVLGIDPDVALTNRSNIAMYFSDITKKQVVNPETGKTSEVFVDYKTVTFEVWPEGTQIAPRAGTQADVVYVFDAAETLTNKFETIARQHNIPVLTNKFDKAEVPDSRFYKTRIEVEPTLKK